MRASGATGAGTERVARSRSKERSVALGEGLARAGGVAPGSVMRPGNAGASTADGRLQRPSAGAREAVRGWDLSARDPAARRHRQRLHALTHDCHEAKICFSPGYELDGRDPGTITSRPRP